MTPRDNAAALVPRHRGRDWSRTTQVAHARQRWAAEIAARKLLVLCVGLGDELGRNLTFYVSKQSTRSSFSRVKATKKGAIKIEKTIDAAWRREIMFFTRFLAPRSRTPRSGRASAATAVTGWRKFGTPDTRSYNDGCRHRRSPSCPVRRFSSRSRARCTSPKLTSRNWITHASTASLGVSRQPSGRPT